MRLSNSKLLSYSILLVLFLILSCDSRVPTNVTNEPGDGDINQLNVWVNSGYIVLDGVNSMVITGIGTDIRTVSGEVASSFTHKIPVKVQDASGNQESYFLLLTQN